MAGNVEMKREVVIYSLPTWPHCGEAKEFLAQKGIEYTNYDVSKNKDRLKEMVDISGQLGVPVITIDGKVLKGFNRKKVETLLGA